MWHRRQAGSRSIRWLHCLGRGQRYRDTLASQRPQGSGLAANRPSNRRPNRSRTALHRHRLRLPDRWRDRGRPSCGTVASPGCPVCRTQLRLDFRRKPLGVDFHRGQGPSTWQENKRRDLAPHGDELARAQPQRLTDAAELARNNRRQSRGILSLGGDPSHCIQDRTAGIPDNDSPQPGHALKYGEVTHGRIDLRQNGRETEGTAKIFGDRTARLVGDPWPNPMTPSADTERATVVIIPTLQPLAAC